MGAPKLANVGGLSGLTGYLAIPKTIMIYNPKLGIIMRGLQLFVVIFFFWNYVQDRSWMYETSVPEGFVSFWASTDSKSFRDARDHEESLMMCQNAGEFAYKGPHKQAIPHGCINPMPGDEWLSMDTSMFVPTFFEDTWMEQTAGDEDCSKLQVCCGGGRPAPATCADVGFDDGEFTMLTSTNLLNQSLCRCVRHRSYFVRGAEGIEIYLHPSFTVVSADGKRTAGTTTNKDDHIVTLVKSPSHKMLGKDKKDGSEKKESEKKESDQHHSLIEPASLADLGGSLPADMEHLDAPVDEGAQLKPRVAKTSARRAISHAAGRTALEVLGNGDARVYRAGLASPQPALMRRQQEALLSNSSPAWLQQNQGSEIPRQSFPEMWASYLGSKASYFGSKVSQLSHHEAADAVPVTRIEPGNTVNLPLERWLAKALLVEGQHGSPQALKDLSSRSDSILDASNTGANKNEIPDSPHEFPTYRTTGLELTLELVWMNKIAHGMPEYNGTLLEIEAFARGGWHSKPSVYHLRPIDPTTGRSKSVQRNFNGVKIRFQSTGKFSHFSFVAVSTALSAIAIYIGLPVLLINALALNALGHASSYYYLSARQLIYPKDIMLGLCARTFVLLRSLASNGAGKDIYTFAEIKDHLIKAFSEEGEEVQEDAPILAKMVINEYGNAKTNTITAAQLANACLSNESIGAAEAAPLWIKDRDQGNAFSRAMNWLFVPESDFPDRNPDLESEFTVTLTKKVEGSSLGVDIDFSDGATIIITQIREGLFAEWNAAHPEQLVQVDDSIVEVNGTRGNSVKMMEACKTAATLELVMKRKVEEQPEDGKDGDGKDGDGTDKDAKDGKDQ